MDKAGKVLFINEICLASGLFALESLSLARVTPVNQMSYQVRFDMTSKYQSPIFESNEIEVRKLA